MKIDPNNEAIYLKNIGKKFWLAAFVIAVISATIPQAKALDFTDHYFSEPFNQTICQSGIVGQDGASNWTSCTVNYSPMTSRQWVYRGSTLMWTCFSQLTSTTITDQYGQSHEALKVNSSCS